ncbi:MAG: hypothetical protein JWP97_5777 [Labilithrix sp.]|nr:hypothetical protein [Labilithrix sp.]
MKRSVLLPFALALLAPELALAADPPSPPAAAAPAPAAGRVSDPAAAQTLFYDARKLMEKGNYADACPKLEESMRLDEGVGTQFNLADCHEHVGKLASAWAGFLDVAAQAKSAGQPDREKVARKRAAAIEPRLPRLVVDVPPNQRDVMVKRDGVAIGSAAWGAAIPVDAGPHRISVTAPGKQWETTTTAIEKQTVHVTVPRELPPAPLAAATPGPAAAPALDNTADLVAPPRESRGATQRTAGWIVAGVGVVGLGLGAGFGLSSIGKRDDSRNHCVADQCDAEGVGLRDDAIKSGNIATIATVAGAAAVAGGLILVLTAPHGTRERTPQTTAIRAVPTAGPGSGGLMLTGSFQ